MKYIKRGRKKVWERPETYPEFASIAFLQKELIVSAVVPLDGFAGRWAQM